jgi:S-adenosylmethionine-diacylglycerol 3-amino-3-carboxypropyl transferase
VSAADPALRSALVVTAPARTGASIAVRAPFDLIRYGSSWEDADVLCEALAPRAAGGRLLSIASAGDNALALLTLDPAEVVAVDLSDAQLACVALRIAAFRLLEDDLLLELLGVSPSARRTALYHKVRGELDGEARAFWDAHPNEIEQGVIHAGKFERYLRSFRRRILPLVHSDRTIRELCALDSIEAQRRFYAERWDTWRWRLLFKVFFSRFVMGRLGRDPEFFAEVKGPVGERILARSRWALTEIPLRTNPYFHYIMMGNFAAPALPRYLRPEHRAAIRARLDRVRLVSGPAQEAEGDFDGFYLSDIFEYMPAAEADRTYEALAAKARPGARLVYWNMLVPRRRPESLAASVRPLDDLAADLHARDRAWFYQWLRVDEVTG